jgi:NurA-like 5'-3' nuclease
MKQVFAKIAKIGEEVRAADPMKIEFALVDDIRSRAAAMQKDLSNLQSVVREVLDAKKRATSLMSSLSDTVSAQQREINKAVQSMKELGIDDSILMAQNNQVGEILNEIRNATKQIGL